jgi:hypothetical protein
VVAEMFTETVEKLVEITVDHAVSPRHSARFSDLHHDGARAHASSERTEKRNIL